MVFQLISRAYTVYMLSTGLGAMEPWERRTCNAILLALVLLWFCATMHYLPPWLNILAAIGHRDR
eukprot:m.88470 g.88470  ORF g.88470 m.88470 type:complete len:65 (-) comp14540_c2_seq1:446-640(-)